jgi:transposase
MQVKSILNKIAHNKGFVFDDGTWCSEKESLIFGLSPRKKSRPICSGCNNKGSTYDHLKMRLFEFVPLWGITIYFAYSMRRVNCKKCGVTVEAVPWAEGKKHLTNSYAHFLSDWAKLISWTDVAKKFNTSWHTVYRAVSTLVAYGLSQRSLGDATAIGVDEVQVGNGHQYVTLVYQLNGKQKRLLYVGKERTKKTLLYFFHKAGKEWCDNVEFVCSDMWPAYLTVIKKKLKNSLNVLDRFHIVKKINEAVNKVRVAETKELKENNKEHILKDTKYCFLKNPENLTENQSLKLKDILQYKLKTVRAYHLKESFQFFWNYNSPYWAEWYLKKWCTRAMRSKLEPIKKFVKTVRKHEGLILNYFEAKKIYSSGAVEGLNRRVNLIMRRAYGYKSLEVLKTALYHTMGHLPEPQRTHKF